MFWTKGLCCHVCPTLIHAVIYGCSHTSGREVMAEQASSLAWTRFAWYRACLGLSGSTTLQRHQRLTPKALVVPDANPDTPSFCPCAFV